MASATRGATRVGRRRRWTPSRWLGLVLLLVGLGILGWAGWQFFGTNVAARKAASQETQTLRSQWQAAGKPAASGNPTAAPVAGGDGMALLWIPDLGASYEWPILAGTDAEVLGKGVGWYEKSARPGQVGNFAIAGHRVTHGEPFRRLLELRKGSEVVVETREATYTYLLDNAPSELTVQDTDGWVLDPVPGKPSATPNRALITLTTCQDLFHSPDRSVAFGHLVKTEPK
ncbi:MULTISPECIES: class E sortase [unclassified Luteococcus]|uniref:class E sortase n=1 Tax=unclassified Luteococcus TaxID=2639923 RepID=UPI00313C6316